MILRGTLILAFLLTFFHVSAAFSGRTVLFSSSSPDTPGSETTTTSMSLPLRKADNYPVKVLGICGGIGSGKSAACQLLVSQLHAIAHIDTDSIAHTVYEPTSPVVEQVLQIFGDDIRTPEGTIDRKKLGSIVFADREAMQQLEAIVWPHVQKEIEKRIQSIRTQYRAERMTSSNSRADNEDSSRSSTSKEPVIVVEAAVLLDAGWQHAFLDAVWVVTVPYEIALQRMMETRGLSRDDAMKRIEAQQSRRGIGNIQQELKEGVVTATIDNSGTLEELQQSLAMKLKDPSAWYGSGI